MSLERQNKETNKHQLEEVQILLGKILWMDNLSPAGADDIYVCLFIGLQENKHLGCAKKRQILELFKLKRFEEKRLESDIFIKILIFHWNTLRKKNFCLEKQAVFLQTLSQL